jgi:peptidyl-tRNA hydrolase
MDKLYIIVRDDLSPGQQAVQGMHALRQFVAECSDADIFWFATSNTLAVLSVPNERALGVLYRKAKDRSVPVAAFREPDRDNEMTSIAIGPTGRILTKNLPLAFRWHHDHAQKRHSGDSDR